ncbi:hypothetical protein HYV74_01405 [Candidatus Uhrbacteria bacterium]|nr:hypothetical protein [Candidatus Uhrbacteria bacterium]
MARRKNTGTSGSPDPDAPASTVQVGSRKKTRPRQTDGANDNSGHAAVTAESEFDEEAFRKVVAFQVTCVGISPILMAAADERKTLEIDGGISEDDKAEKGSSVEAIREHARKYVMPRKLYRDAAGRVGIPAENFLEALMQAGVKIKHDKKQLTTGKHSYVPSLLDIVEDFLLFPESCQDQPDGTPGWVEDYDHGWGKTGTFVAIKRPKFEVGSWGFRATLMFNPSEIPPKVVRQLVAIAGRFVGLGGHRPGKRGRFGKFVIGDWQQLAVAPALNDRIDVQKFVKDARWPEPMPAAAST